MKKGKFPDGFDLDLSPIRDFVGKLDSMFQQSFKHLNDHFHLKPFHVEVKETEKNVLVVAELPGVDPKQIELEIIGNQLRITAKDSISMETKNTSNHYYEKTQSYQKMERVVSIPFIIPQNETTASFENGLLTVTIPKKNTDRKYIDIN